MFEQHRNFIAALFFLLLNCINICSAQSPTWEWAKSAGGPVFDYGSGLALGVSGNIYVSGNFNSDSISFGNTTLINANTDTTDIFIAKYDANGNVLWAQGAGGQFYDRIYSITTDKNENIYLTGSFASDSITFGGITLINDSASKDDIFLVKLDSSGSTIWAKRFGGADGDVGTALCIDSSGNLFLAGNFISPLIVFDADTLFKAINGYSNIFISKFDSSGNLLWVKSTGGEHNFTYYISLDADGNLFLTGYFYGYTITFGNFTLVNANAAITDIFVVKYDSSGSVIWANGSGGEDDDYANNVVINRDGDAYFVGYFNSPSITFGSYTLIKNSSYASAFLVKYDSLGNVIWALQGSGPGENRCHGITLDGNGNLYVTGMFSGNSFTLNNYTLPEAFNNSGSDIFIMKCDSSGNVIWGKSVGGDDNDFGFNIAHEENGSTYIVGDISSDSVWFDNTLLTCSGGYNIDFFVAKLGNVNGIEAFGISANNFFLAPNPITQNTFQIKYLVQQPKQTELELMSIEGRQLFLWNLDTKIVGNHEQSFPLPSTIANGIYLLRITSAQGGKQVLKMVVAR